MDDESLTIAPGDHGEPRRRLILALIVCAVATAIAASVANHNRIWLRCESGQAVPYRGRWLPLGQAPLPPEDYPPLGVSEGTCRDETLGSIEALQARYEARSARLDAAVERAAERLTLGPRGPASQPGEIAEAPPPPATVEAVERELARLQTAIERVDQSLARAAREGTDSRLLSDLQTRRVRLLEAALRERDRATTSPTGRDRSL